MKRYELSRKFTFGQYKDQPVAKIIDEDPHYVKWASDNVEFFKLDRKEKRALKKSLEEAPPRYYQYDEEYEHELSQHYGIDGWYGAD